MGIPCGSRFDSPNEPARAIRRDECSKAFPNEGWKHATAAVLIERVAGSCPDKRRLPAPVLERPQERANREALSKLSCGHAGRPEMTGHKTVARPKTLPRRVSGRRVATGRL